MGTEVDAPRTRRRLLLGGLGGVAALLANGLGRPQSANAGVDGDVILGAENTAATTTKVRNPTTVDPALWGAGASAIGVKGTSSSAIGVEGTSSSGSGVNGRSETWDGVTGFSTSGNGVHGVSGSGYGVRALSLSGTSLFVHSFDGLPVHVESAECKAAIYALNQNLSGTYPAVLGVTRGSGPGIMGVWGNDAFAVPVGVSGPDQTGVYGVILRGLDGPPVPSSTGVHGRSDGGRGVYGQTISGKGVVGEATGTTGTTYGVYGKVKSRKGHAVYGDAATGTGVRGSTQSGTAGAFYARTGYALSASGRVRLDRASGIATIRAGRSAVTVTPGLNVSASSFVLLTPRSDLGSRRLWYTTNTTANTITIKLSSPPGTSVRIGWLLLG